jgi:hypothetical protein
MPYIKPADRVALYFEPHDTPQNAGELNYLFSEIARRYLHDKGKSYQTMNDIVGALDGAKTEFNRRVVAPYEDLKIEENGDVYHEERRKP